MKPVVENPAVESEPVWREAKKVLRAQVVLSALASLILALVWGAQAGAWSLAGGAVCIAPSAWFASRLSRAAVRSPGSFAIWLFAGEMVKVLAEQICTICSLMQVKHLSTKSTEIRLATL